MKITKITTIVVNMPMIIEGAVVPKHGGKPRTATATASSTACSNFVCALSEPDYSPVL